MTKGETEMNKNLVWAAAAMLAAVLVAGGTAIAQTAGGDQNGQNCRNHVNTDKGEGGVQVYSCKDGEGGIGFGGPIKDVDRDHPVGKGDAFLPKAGRDAQTVVQDVGHGVEHATHEVGKALSKAFGW
jgi:hypothetical protein